MPHLHQIPRAILVITVLICISTTASFFFNGRNINMYALSSVAATIAFLSSLLFSGKLQIEIGPLGGILTFYFVWSAVAITWSQAPYMSVIELGTIGPALALFFAWRTLTLNYACNAFSVFLVALGSVFAAVILAQYAAGSVPRVTFPNPNSAAGFINILWPAAAIGWLQANSSRRKRIACLILAFLLILAIGVQGSRGALIGSIVGLSILLYVGAVILKRPKPSLTLAATFIGALISANILGDHALQTGMGSIADPGLAGSSRFTIWAATWEMILDRPWLGYGPGVFWIAYPAYRHASDGSAGMFAHNDYLEFWLETGILGLFLIILLGIASIYTFKRAINAYRTDAYKDDQAFLTVTAAFVGVSGTAAHSVFTYNLQMMPFVLIVPILLAQMEHASGVRLPLRVPLQSIQTRLLPMISIIALSLIPIGHFARTAAAFAEIENGTRYLANDNHDAAAASFSTASALWSQMDTPWYMHANTLVEGLRANKDLPASKKKDLVDQAESLLDKAEERNPLRANTALVRGLLQSDHPEWTTGSAEESLKKAVALDPRNIEARYALTQVLHNRGRTDDALEVIETGLAINFADGINLEPLVQRRAELQRALAGTTTASPESRPEEFSIETGPIQADEGAAQR